MNIQINPYIVAVVIIVLLLGIVIAAAVRQRSFLEFERRKRAGHLAELISKMVTSASKGRTTSLIIEKQYVQYVLDDLMLMLPTAGIERVKNEIIIRIGLEKWSVPISGYHKA